MRKIIGCLIVILSASAVNAADYNNEIGNGRDNANLVLLGPTATRSSSEIIFSEGLGSFGNYTGISIRHNSSNGDLVFERNNSRGTFSTPLLSLKTKLTPVQARTTPTLDLGSNSQVFASLGTAYVGAIPTAVNAPTVAAFGNNFLRSSNQYAIAQSSTGELRINAPTTSTINFYSGGSNKHTSVNSIGDWTMNGRLYVNNTLSASRAEFGSVSLGGITLSPGNILIHEQASLDQLRDARVLTSTYSTYLGQGAGPTGFGMHNTAVGHNALTKGGATNYNTAIGSHSLAALSSGQLNTAVGLGAMQNMSYGSRNTAVGQAALVSASSVYGVTALGVSSLYSLKTGENNIAIGEEAADSMSSGDNNIFIGRDVQGSAYTGNPYALYAANNELNIGNLLKGSLKAGSKALTVNGNLAVTGKLTVAGGSPLAGAVLTAIDKNGSTQWTAINTLIPGDVADLAADFAGLKASLGYIASANGASLSIPFNSVNGLHLETTSNSFRKNMMIGENLAIGQNNLFDTLLIGTDALASVAPAYASFNNVLVGHKNLWATGSASDPEGPHNNIALGNKNLRGIGFENNIAIGHRSSSGSSVSRLYNNISLGSSSLQSSEAGNLVGNITIGHRAMGRFAIGTAYEMTNNANANHKSAHSNIAIGNRAYYRGSGSSNIAIGDAAYERSVGLNNIAIGIRALHGSSVESVISISSTRSVIPQYNVALGSDALSATHGSSNIAVGDSSGLSSRNGDIAMGRFALGKAGASVMSEYSHTNSHNVAIGFGALNNANAADNIAVGTLALSSLVSNGYELGIANGNIAVGRFALSKNSRGAKNIVIGLDSGNNIVNGNNNIIIGHHLGVLNGEDINSTLNIGGVIVGDLATAKVGIGVDKPARTLHIKDIMRLEPISQAPFDASLGDIFVHTSGAICFYNGDAWERMNTKGDCNTVLIQTAQTPSQFGGSTIQPMPGATVPVLL